MKSLLFGFIALLFISLCYSQEGINVGGFEFPTDFGAEEVTKNLSAPDVATTTIFPYHNNGKIPSGAEVPIVIGFRNNGEKLYNITHAVASFNYPQDYSYYIQNFTEQYYHYTVGPSEEISLEYTLYPDPLLDMRDFGLVVSIFYHDGNSQQVGNNFTSVVWNKTVDIIELDTGFDPQTLFAYIAILAVLGLAGYVVYRNLNSWTKGQKKGKGGASKATESSTGSSQEQVLDNDWLTGTVADPRFRKRKNN